MDILTVNQVSANVGKCWVSGEYGNCDCLDCGCECYSNGSVALEG